MGGDLQILRNCQHIQSGDDGTSWACDLLGIVVAMESGGLTLSRNRVIHSRNFINRDLTVFLLIAESDVLYILLILELGGVGGS